jgi:peptidoglycan/LPS O-acetylase OafA/YrhL
MSKSDYYKPLTGYRAMAAYMVFIVHFNPFEYGTFTQAFFAGFGIGVPLFFVLSGFLIYTRYNTFEITSSFYKMYMVNRVARIYPVYFLVTTVTLFFNYKAAAFTPYWMKIYLLNITFIRGFFQKYIATLVVQGWSLTVEEVFYFLAPILFLFGGNSIRKYLGIFLGLFALGWLLSFISVDMLNGYFWYDHKFMVIHTFFGNSFSFIVGILIGVLNDRYKEISFKYMTLVGFIGLFIVLLLLSQLNNVTVHKSENLFSWKGLMVYHFVGVPFIGALIWGLIHERTWVSRLFSTEIFQVLGKSSYSFYLIHFGIVHSIIKKFISDDTFLLFILLVLTAYLLWRFIEEPLNEGIRRRAKQILAV